MINYTENFDTSLPQGFALAAYRATGTNTVPTVTYNATYGAVDLVQTGNSHGQWRFQNPSVTDYPFTGCLDFDVSYDFEMLSGTLGELHCGFHLRSENGEEAWQFGNYKNPSTLVTQQGVWYGQVGGAWNSGMEAVGFTQGTVTPLFINTRYIFRVVRAAGSNLISFYINEVLSFTYTGISASTVLWPDLFLYNNNLRVHSITFISNGYVENTPAWDYFNDTFNSNTVTGYTSGYNGTGCTVTYNSGAGAYDVGTTVLDNKAWIISEIPTSKVDNFVYEVDLEMISDPANRKHAGLWLATSNSSNMYGYRLTHLDSSWIWSSWNGWSSETGINPTNYSNPTFNVGDRRRIRVDKRGSNLRLYVDDRIVFSGTNSAYIGLRPGIHTYGSTVRVHNVFFKSFGKLVIANDASFSNLHNLILAKNPLIYFDVAESTNTTLTNKGSMNITGTWWGTPVLIPDSYCNFAALTGFHHVRLTCPDTTVSTANGVTVETLIKLDSYRSQARVLEICNAARTSLLINSQRDAANKFGLGYFNGTTNGSIYSSIPPLYNNVLHIVSTIKPSGVESIYVNGVLVSKGQNTLTLTSLNNIIKGNLFYSQWQIDAAGGSDQTVLGAAKFVAMYNTVLSDTEIYNHAAQVSILNKDIYLPAITNVSDVKCNTESRTNIEGVMAGWLDDGWRPYTPSGNTLYNTTQELVPFTCEDYLGIWKDYGGNWSKFTRANLEPEPVYDGSGGGTGGEGGIIIEGKPVKVDGRLLVLKDGKINAVHYSQLD